MKKMLLVFSIMVFGACFGMIGCQDIPPLSTDSSQQNSSVLQTDQALKRVAMDFTRAFLCGKKEQVTAYLLEPSQIDTFRPAVYSGVREEDIVSVTCQSINVSHLDNTITASCAFLTEDAIQTYYLDIDLTWTQGEWKVVNYYLQG